VLKVIARAFGSDLSSVRNPRVICKFPADEILQCPRQVEHFRRPLLGAAIAILIPNDTPRLRSPIACGFRVANSEKPRRDCVLFLVAFLDTPLYEGILKAFNSPSE
jgi:hypothetical protein